MKPSEILRQAKAGLPGHWIKGRLSDDAGNRCGLGWVICATNELAIAEDTSSFIDSENKAVTYLHRATPAMLARDCRTGLCTEASHEASLDVTLSGLVDAHETKDGHVVGHWFAWFNDADKTTEADVLATFDRAIALAEAEGD